ncbi:hypothetical protein UPYG_G00168310 [Umbra pygmaea]|uniref:TNFR-Cys domain-containing protein n=1 Tax=Umbra pygmaea TaxID=75934 RepID=A0ABD0WNE8_UMBPY
MSRLKKTLLLLQLAIEYELLCDGLKCPPCPGDRYVVQNCSLPRGTTCHPCSDCSGEGKMIVSSCTQFFDAVCGCKNGYNITSKGDCQKLPELGSTTLPLMTIKPVEPMGAEAIVIVLIGVLVFIVLVLSVSYMWCRKNIYIKGVKRKLPQVV